MEMEMETVHIKYSYSYKHTHRPGGARRSTGSNNAGCGMHDAGGVCDVTYVMRYDAEASGERR